MYYINSAFHHLLLFRLLPHTILMAIPLMVAMAFLAVMAHEGAHYVAGRLFGMRGCLVLFARRGVTRLWFMSLFAIDFSRTSMYQTLSSNRRRVVIAAGPLCDIVLATICLVIAHHYGASGGLVVATMQLLGGLLLPMTILLNIIPHAGKNDGWMFVWPNRALTGHEA